MRTGLKGQERQAVRLPVAQALLRAGDNVVRLVAEGGELDVSLVDVIRLSYWRLYRAEGDRLWATVPGRQAVTLGGFSSPRVRVLDVTEAPAVEEVAGEVRAERGGVAITVAAPRGG